MQHHGTAQGLTSILRHASIRTTSDIYVQMIDTSVQQPVNSRTAAVLEGFSTPVDNMGLQGRDFMRPIPIRQND